MRSCPRPLAAIVQRWVGLMAQGMRQLGDPERGPRFVKRQGVDILQEESDYDAYCYYVAGTVGIMASELVVRQYGLPDETARPSTCMPRPAGAACRRPTSSRTSPRTWRAASATCPISG